MSLKEEKDETKENEKSNENIKTIDDKNSSSINSTPLIFIFVNFSSQDPSHPIKSLLGYQNNSEGWLSSRFCTYPQEIFIQFYSKVHLKQFNILINETKIPTMIELIKCIPINKNKSFDLSSARKNNKEYNFQEIGFIKFCSNMETNYKARELRKVFLDVDLQYLKLIIHKNYSNIHNTFSQVGIVKLEFLGNYLKENKNSVNKFNTIDININNENNENNENNVSTNNDNSYIDEKMDKQSSNKLKELIEEMKKYKKDENYDECKLIKNQIEKLRKLNIKIYNLELYKKECVDKDDFDNAKKIKSDLDIFRKLLNNYINNINQTSNNNNETNLKYRPISSRLFSLKNNVTNSQKNQMINNEEYISNYDNLILPGVIKKMNIINNQNETNRSNENNINSNNSSGNYDSFNFMNESDPIEKEPLEDLNNEIKTKYVIIIEKIGEEIIKKIFSKHIYYKEEGFDLLISKVNEIIGDTEKNTVETNKYIVSLIDIFFTFLDDKHPSIVTKSLDLFINILKAVEERSKNNKMEYDFKVTKNILDKIKENLNHISKRVRLKASELYCYMLDTDFCEYNTLIIELVKNEVFDYCNKLYQFNSSNNNKNLIGGNIYFGNVSSKQLIITKMNIFLNIFKNLIEGKNKKINKNKFPINIVSDFIIMNINHPKEEVRGITKEAMIDYIKIFGNKIFYKLKMMMDRKEIIKIIQDKEELKNEFANFENSKENEMIKSATENDIFLTNIKINKYLLNNNKNRYKKLFPILKKTRVTNRMQSTKITVNNRNLNSVSDRNNSLINNSQQKLTGNKIKLKPIKNRVLNKNRSNCDLIDKKNMKKIINNLNEKSNKNVNRSTEEIRVKGGEDINTKKDNTKQIKELKEATSANKKTKEAKN